MRKQHYFLQESLVRELIAGKEMRKVYEEERERRQHIVIFIQRFESLVVRGHKNRKSFVEIRQM